MSTTRTRGQTVAGQRQTRASATSSRPKRNGPLKIASPPGTRRNCRACTRAKGKPVGMHGRTGCPLKPSAAAKKAVEEDTAAELDTELQRRLDELDDGRMDDAGNDMDLDDDEDKDKEDDEEVEEIVQEQESVVDAPPQDAGDDEDGGDDGAASAGDAFVWDESDNWQDFAGADVENSAGKFVRAVAADQDDSSDDDDDAKTAKGSKKRVKLPIANGWKGTSAGGDHMPLKRVVNDADKYRQKVEGKKVKVKHDTTPMFESIVLPAEFMAECIPSWIFVAAMPKGNNGELRTWHSASIETDNHELPQKLRDVMFEQLKGVRVQHLKEELRLKEKLRQEKEAQEEELREAQRVSAALRKTNKELMKEIKAWRTQSNLADRTNSGGRGRVVQKGR